MTKQPQRLDDYDAFDERGVLRDGKRWTVPMSFMDSMQRSVAQHFAKVTLPDHRIDLHDGYGGVVGFRPGWAVPTDNRVFDAVEQAHAEYQHRITNAWRDDAGQNPPTGAGSVEFRGMAVGQACTVKGSRFKADFGSAGTIQRMPDGSLDCVPLKPTRATAPARSDASKQDAKDWARIREEMYANYDAEISSSWARGQHR